MIWLRLVISRSGSIVRMGLLLHFRVQPSCHRGPSRGAQDTSRRCREVGLLLHFPYLLPRVFRFAAESGWRNGRSSYLATIVPFGRGCLAECRSLPRLALSDETIDSPR